MITLVWSKRFIKAVKKITKKNPEIISSLAIILERLQIDPFHPTLKSHKLKGSLSGCWACSVEYDYRIIFEIYKTGNEKEIEILLLSFGTHDEVY